MDIIFLAIVAIYIFIKLRQQLGKVDDEQKHNAIRDFIKEQTKIRQNPGIDNADGSVVVDMNTGKIVKNPNFDEKSQKILDNIDDNLRQAVTAILQKVGISAFAFISGASKAFEIIIDAFSKDDVKTLKPLLSEEVLHQFQLAIKTRHSKSQNLNTKIVAIDESKIINAKLQKDYAVITVKFTSRQINYITDEKDNVIEGSKEKVNIINDNWTFKKYLDIPNPNWFVCATAY